MRHSTFSKALMVLASTVAATSLHLLPAMAQPAPVVQRSGQPQVVQLDSTVRPQPPARLTPSFPAGGLGLIVQPCPEGTYPIIWDQPVYDESGLFVVGYVPVRYCIDEDLEPAG